MSPRWLLLLLLFALPASVSAESVTAASEGVDAYGEIFNVVTVDDPAGEVVARIFETGGGDPAMNGNHLVLHLATTDPAGNAFTWRTGLNIYELKSAKLKNRKLTLKGTEHRMGDGGGIGTHPVTIEIVFRLEGDALSPTIDVKKR